MDDFPAGPASPGPRRPPLSVVIPVHNGGTRFERCLRGLRDSTWTDYEFLVIDDGSTDGSAALAETFGATVVRHARPQGPAAARNAGAEAARGPLIFFLDADVVLHPDVLERVVNRFAARPDLAALFGSYDAEPSDPGLVSQYRNLLHHFVHQQGQFDPEGFRLAHTFWTGCGAIRRRTFLDLGGFNPQLYRRPAIEDIELGYRLTRAGHRIELARDIQATHLKQWTLRDVVRTDIFRRGVPWALLMLRSGVIESDLNVSRTQKVCVAATGLAILASLAAPWLPQLLGVSLACGALNVGLNREFFRFLVRRRSWAFAAAAVPLHHLYYVCCGLSVLFALAIHHRPAAAVGRRLATRPSAHRHDPADAAPRAPIPPRARRNSRWTRPRPRPRT